MLPSKITIVQHLREFEKVARVTLAEWCKFKISTDSNLLSSIVLEMRV